jgi:hypothetical protein
LGISYSIAFGQLKHGNLGIIMQVINGFFVFNDGAKMNSYNPQIMQCIVCHGNPIDLNGNMFPMGKAKVL